jgi:hypothetical protein
MVQTIQAKDLSLHDVKEKFGLHLAEDEQFFREWKDELPQISDVEKRSLDRVKADYLYLSEYPIPESLVGLVVLSPLLSLAGFYRPPFRVTTEASVQISAEDEGEVVQGRIDILVIQKQLWILVIESKRGSFSLEAGIPQALAYMMANPNPAKASFGLVTNGNTFRFIKLIKQDTLKYGLSDLFAIDRGDDLYNVLRVMKRLGALMTQNSN